MIENGEFSEDQSEELIEQLRSSTLTGNSHLQSALKLLSHVSELSPSAVPPLLPSSLNPDLPSTEPKRSKAHRPAITSFIVTTILASASFAAAGVTGRGPVAIVNAAQSSGEIIKSVVVNVGDALTGKSSSPKPKISQPAPAVSHNAKDQNLTTSGDSGEHAKVDVPGPVASESTGEDQNGEESDHTSTPVLPTPITKEKHKEVGTETKPTLRPLPRVSESTHESDSSTQLNRQGEEDQTDTEND